jgi:L-asparaginase II
MARVVHCADWIGRGSQVARSAQMTVRGGLDANRLACAGVLVEPSVVCHQPRNLAENLHP